MPLDPKNFPRTTVLVEKTDATYEALKKLIEEMGEVFAEECEKLVADKDGQP